MYAFYIRNDACPKQSRRTPRVLMGNPDTASPGRFSLKRLVQNVSIKLWNEWKDVARDRWAIRFIFQRVDILKDVLLCKVSLRYAQRKIYPPHFHAYLNNFHPALKCILINGWKPDPSNQTHGQTQFLIHYYLRMMVFCTILKMWWSVLI